MKTLLITVALGATMISAPAAAQTPGGGEGGPMMQRDVTRQQTQQMADSMFQQFDVNHDGVVTRAEAEQVAGQMAAARGGGDSGGGRGGGRAERMISRVFGNAQSLTVAQFEAQALARFDAQDLNHDGIVSAAERQQARQQRAGQNPTQ